MLRIALHHIVPEVVLKCRIVCVQGFRDLVLLQKAFFLYLGRNATQQIVFLQEEPQQGKAFFAQGKEVELFVAQFGYGCKTAASQSCW